MKTALFVLVSSVLGVHALRAQEVPRWTVDLAIGGGPRTENAGETWYDGKYSGVLRYAVSLRLGPPARLAPYVSVELSPNVVDGWDTMCRPSPNGTCRQPFDDTGGLGVGVGARYALTRKVLVGAEVGGGGYHGARGFLEANAALRLMSHVALVTTVRETRWRSDGHGYWHRPLTVGIQFN